MHNRHGRALSVPLQLSLCAYQTKTETHTSLIDTWNFWHSDSKWICIASKIFNEWIFSSTPKMVWFARSTTHASGQNITEVNKKKTKNISIDRARSARFVHARQVIAARQWSKYRKPAYPLRSSRKGHAGLHVSAIRLIEMHSVFVIPCCVENSISTACRMPMHCDGTAQRKKLVFVFVFGEKFRR